MPEEVRLAWVVDAEPPCVAPDGGGRATTRTFRLRPVKDGCLNLRHRCSDPIIMSPWTGLRLSGKCPTFIAEVLKVKLEKLERANVRNNANSG